VVCASRCSSSFFLICNKKLNLVTIPLIHKEDKLIWKKSHDGNLSFKDAYLFQSASSHQHPSWSKCIWNVAIPPSKYLLTWRILHEKMPTNEHLIQRGYQITTICNLCSMAAESSVHLFLECNFSQQIWNWLHSILNINFSVATFLDSLKIIERNWSPQCKVVLLAAIINCYNTILFCRNQRRFQDKIINFRTAKSLIISSTSLSGNITALTSRSSISEFVILKHFDVKIKPPKPQIIKEAIWATPFANWVKCNTDEASLGNPEQQHVEGFFETPGQILWELSLLI